MRGTVHDVVLGLCLRGPQAKKRVTEYCQWAEIQHQRCETCTRSVSGKDGSSRTESYRCNCVTSYQYIKQKWRSYRIQSAFFNQPFNHNNPQRDPFPSMEFASNDASIIADGDEKLIVALDRSLLSKYVPWRGLVWTAGGVTPPSEAKGLA